MKRDSAERRRGTQAHTVQATMSILRVFLRESFAWLPTDVTSEQPKSLSLFVKTQLKEYGPKLDWLRWRLTSVHQSAENHNNPKLVSEHYGHTLQRYEKCNKTTDKSSTQEKNNS